MNITLQPMSQEIFENYYEQSIEEYAAEHVQAGNWTEEEAIPNAQEQFKQLLPNGLDTLQHVLFSVQNEQKESIGVLWIKIEDKTDERRAFIYDIKLHENQRDKGYGRATMHALEEYAGQTGIKQIGLHVFAHNKRALALYEKLGYEVTDLVMKKRL
ncbi:GNAT family N-acetyltransferase [Pontibacillus yanchengensis]|uniref:GNAT family acetyltransferase n=1 Tax=Pontibacillus yanchengensis Y32 TaxID=1385514 RepID=A0A0A2TG33_9BACI|nr:GNAT family N-acetyltransferase [Pontibacillus yanchengensis]KGP73066.1 GNAT family acetyltransferase [Pontibacillus yanchengensis Y32]